MTLTAKTFDVFWPRFLMVVSAMLGVVVTLVNLISGSNNAEAYIFAGGCLTFVPVFARDRHRQNGGRETNDD